MDREAELIKQQMEATRASLADKLESLQGQVVGSVQATTSAVTGTVEAVRDTIKDAVDGVKDSVQDTVDTVKGAVTGTVDTMKHALDFREQYEAHPWLFFGASVAAGYAGGLLLHGAEDRKLRAWMAAAMANAPWSHRGPGADFRAAYTAENTLSSMAASAPSGAAEANGRTGAQGKEEHSWLTGLGDMFGGEVQQLKGLAIGALLGVAKNMIRANFGGGVSGQLTNLVDSFTTKLGGKPVEGPIFKEGHADRSTAGAPQTTLG